MENDADKVRGMGEPLAGTRVARSAARAVHEEVEAILRGFLVAARMLTGVGAIKRKQKRPMKEPLMT